MRLKQEIGTSSWVYLAMNLTFTTSSKKSTTLRWIMTNLLLFIISRCIYRLRHWLSEESFTAFLMSLGILAVSVMLFLRSSLFFCVQLVSTASTWKSLRCFIWWRQMENKAWLSLTQRRTQWRPWRALRVLMACKGLIFLSVIILDFGSVTSSAHAGACVAGRTKNMWPISTK